MDIVIGYFSNKELLWDTVEDKVSYGRDVDISMDIRERILAEVNNGVLCGFLLFSPNYDVVWKLDSSDINTKALLNCIKYLSMEEFLIKYGNKGLLPGKVVNYFHTDGSYPRRNFKGNMCSLNYKSSAVQRHFEVCTDTCVSSVIDWLKDNGFLCGMNIIVEDVTVVVYMYKSFMVFMQYNTLSDIVDKCVGCVFYSCIRNYGVTSSTLVGLRGILLWGTPGCGKTSLAKAIAKEANVNFLCRNAADLISGYSMSNENKIGELFKKARENAPCVIFIDELDIIGERYTGGMGAGAHQVEVTRLLAEMDGFQKNENILVIGATNDIAKLDKALLRSGRFSKKFHVGMPQKREDILAVINMYKGNKPFEEGITDDDLIKTLGRLTPADIKELLNECGIYAVMSNSCITLDLLNKTILELNLGTNLVESDKAMSPEKKRLLAVHEAAHALVGRALGFGITGVSLVGTQTGVGGMTYVKVVPNNHEWEDMMIPSNSYTTYEMVLSSVIMRVAGAVGELLDNDGNFLKVSTGCKEDLARNYDMLADFVKCYSLDLKHLTCLKATGVEGLIYALQCICNDIAKEILETNKSIYYSFVDALVRTGELREADINILSEGLKGYVLDYNSLLGMFNNYTTSMDTEAVFKYNV